MRFLPRVSDFGFSGGLLTCVTQVRMSRIIHNNLLFTKSQSRLLIFQVHNVYQLSLFTESQLTRALIRALAYARSLVMLFTFSHDTRSRIFFGYFVVRDCVLNKGNRFHNACVYVNRGLTRVLSFSRSLARRRVPLGISRTKNLDPSLLGSFIVGMQRHPLSSGAGQSSSI